MFFLFNTAISYVSHRLIKWLFETTHNSSFSPRFFYSLLPLYIFSTGERLFHHIFQVPGFTSLSFSLFHSLSCVLFIFSTSGTDFLPKILIGSIQKRQRSFLFRKPTEFQKFQNHQIHQTPPSKMPSPSKTLSALLFLLTLHLSLSLTLSSDSPSAYEILEGFGFPKGILPEGVTSYQLDDDGGFQVLLSCDCELRVEDSGYLLKYGKKITGKVKSGQLKELNGVSVKVVIWLGINEVVKKGTNLYFYVGPLSASFPSSNFEECPKCSCGSRCSIDMVSDS